MEETQIATLEREGIQIVIQGGEYVPIPTRGREDA